MTVTSAKREQIIGDVNASWQALIEKLSEFSEDDLYTPNVIGIWSLKDLIGHLETWDRIAIFKIDEAESGRNRKWQEVQNEPHRSINEFNEADADTKRARSLETLWSELHATHQDLLTRLETTTVLSRDLIREDTYGHYRDHLNDILMWERSQTKT